MRAVSIPPAAPGVNPAPMPDQAPTWTLPTVADRAAGALDALARGFVLLPVDPTTKQPMLRAQPYLDGRRNLDPAAVERWAARGAVFAVALKPSRLLVLDLDTPDPTDAGPMAPCFAGDHVTPTRSPGGRHAWYLRPRGLPAQRRIRAGGLPVDVLGNGYAILWACRVPELGSLPPKLGAVLRPKPRGGGPERSRPARSPAAAVALPGSPGPATPGRAAAIIRGLVAYLVRKVSAMGEDSGRGQALFVAARTVAELIAHAPELAGWAKTELWAAAVACRYVETDGERRAREHLDNGWRAGEAAPLPLPEDRPDWSPAAELPPGGLAEGEAVPAPEEVRAAAFAMLADLPELVAGLTDAEGRPIHPNARLTVELVAGELCRQAIDTGRPWVLASPAALGLERDRGPDSVRRAGPWLDRLGWTLTPGGWTDDGTPKAAHYSLSGIFATRCGDSVSRDGGGGLDVLTATCRKNAPEVLDRAAITLARGAVAGSDLSRGMRRRPGVRPAEGEDTRLKAAGGTIHKLLEALPRIGEADADQLADAAGVSRRTVERNAGRLVERGAWTRRTAPATGRGRPRVLYAVADQAGPLVAATIEAGRRAKAKAQSAIEAFRDLCRRALAAVERGLYATHRAAVSALARIARRRAAAERDAALPGRARQLGRTDADERAAALKETRAWGVPLRQCQAIRSAVELDPPAWATAPTACTAELGI